MRKNFRMYLTLALVMLGVMSVNAQERIPVDAEHFTFHNYNGWDANATETGVATGENGNFLLNEANGCPIGDTNCNAWIDLGAYAKMYVKMAGCDENGELNGSNPRIFINRTVEEGQFNADKSAANCLVIPNAGTWAEEYYTVEGDGTIVIDLTKIGKEWGFVHFHSIKGSAWNTKAIVNSIEVEKAAAGQQIGWVNLINNSDMEGDDVSSFFTKIDQGSPEPSEITDGIGVDGSRGIKVAATAKAANSWDNQFWFRFNEPVPAGTKYRVSFDYRADVDAETETQAHSEPSNYLHWSMFGNINFETNWNTFTTDGEVTAEQSPNGDFQSVAFNLNAFEGANNYYFDNIKFEVYKYGTTAEFDMDIIQIDFGFDTNIPELVKAGGKPRLMFPEGTATVKVNGEDLEITSVEGFADGRFYIFHEQALGDGDVVEVTFTNPTDPAYHLVYTSGPGGDVNNFSGVATNNPDVAVDDAYSYLYETPVILKADPEDGSFNLPNSLAEFKITFDKNVDCGALVAKLGSETLTITPAEGAAEEVTLTRAGGDLADGEYVLTLDKVYPEPGYRLADEIFGTYTIILNIGKINADPNDVPKEMLPETFNECEANAIPEGYFVKFGEEDRPGGTNATSGPRMFDFGAGGDFTKGLYFREGYVEYGSMEGYALTLEAGKKYQIHFNSAMWKDNGPSMRFEVLNSNNEQVLAQMVSNTPNVNGATSAVSGSTSTTIDFVPEATGNYIVRWTSASSVDGDAGYAEIILANPSVKYIPNAAGVEETTALNTALEEAKSTREGNTDERYAGEAFNALDAAIKKYEAEKDGYTAPSQYKNAVEDLNALTDAMKNHRKNCDSYDENVAKVVSMVAEYGETKFSTAAAYVQLKDIAAKYEGKVLTDDAELTVAVAELSDIIALTELFFTEGKSTPEGSNNGKGTGAAVFTERIRLGIEALKSLGVAEDDELIVAASSVLTDDDTVAEAIKNRITLIVYGQLKDADNELFKPVMDENTLEEVTPTYDMTVFVKNPNIYKQQPNMDFTDESVPGWIVPEGFNRPGLTIGWGAAKNVEGVAEDCMFQTWGSSYRVEQTIGDLPAGVYTIQMGFGERMNDDEANFVDSYIYAKTTDSEEPVQVDVIGIGQSFPFAGGSGSMAIENVVVTDGILTIGVNAGPSSHTFFNDVRVLITGAATGFDYGSAYQGAVDGIENTETQSVRAIQLYDLNGNRITTARKGIVIVKKLMNDGTVRTEKVIKK